jgi:hypothetical protein
MELQVMVAQEVQDFAQQLLVKEPSTLEVVVVV